MLKQIMNSISKKTQGLDKKCSNSRLAKSEKCEFTLVNDHFEYKHNAEAGLFLQALNKNTNQLTKSTIVGLGLLVLFFTVNLTAQNAIVTDFNDGSWGDVVDNRPASGEYPSFEANGFSIRKGVLNSGSVECAQGGKHSNCIALDKNNQGASIMLPELVNVGVLEIHASTGSDDKSFVVQELIGRQWETIATYTTVKNPDSIYFLPLHRFKVQLRIANNTGSSLFIWQIKTTQESEEMIAEYERRRPLITNFTDGTWGRPTSKKPETGEYPSSEANGFILNKAFLASGKTTCANDENYTHSGCIVLDKDKTDAFFEFPEIEMVGEVEIHAASGSDDRSFVVQEYDGKRWKTSATFSTGKEERVYTYSAFKEKAKLRIANNTGSSLSVYQVKISRTDAETIARQAKLTGWVTDFNDGTWGDVVAERPESGDYPTFEANDFWIYSGVLNKSSLTCVQGGKHFNWIVLDKDKEMGRIDFPELTDVGEIEIHAATGSDEKSFEVLVKEGRKWESLGIFATTKKEQVYIVPVNKESARLRIRNNTSSSLNIYQIKMRTITALNSLMLQASVPAQDELVYGNLTRKVLLQFNKEITLGDNPIMLNGETIDTSKIRIKGNVAAVPVKVNAGKSNKTYTLEIPQGAFVSDSGIHNEKASLSFSVHKTVSVPVGYNAEIDAIYSNANIAQNRVDIYYPAEIETPVPVLINIHDGGWNHGEKESQTDFNFYFENGMAVANIEYRLTPHGTAPAAIEDVRCAIHYLANNAERLNIDPHKIILSGVSAGGYLALTAGYLGKSSPFDKCSFTGSDFTIAAVIDNYAPADLLQLLDYGALRDWLGEKVADEVFVKSISPVYLVGESTPPTYIIHGDADPVVGYQQSVLLENTLKSAGIKCFFRTVPGGLHGSFLKEYKSIMADDINQFFIELGILK
jgi:acetyl esterase/lipase